MTKPMNEHDREIVIKDAKNHDGRTVWLSTLVYWARHHLTDATNARTRLREVWKIPGPLMGLSDEDWEELSETARALLEQHGDHFPEVRP